MIVRISIFVFSLALIGGCSGNDIQRHRNHEKRIDELENMERGNRTGSPDPSTSHKVRIEKLEKRVEELEKLVGESKEGQGTEKKE